MNALKVAHTALTPLVNLGHNIRYVLGAVPTPHIDASLVRESRRNATQQTRNAAQWVAQRLKPTPQPPIPSSLNPSARLNAMKAFAKTIREFAPVKDDHTASLMSASVTGHGDLAKNKIEIGSHMAGLLRSLASASDALLKALDAIDKDKGLEAQEARQFDDAVRHIVNTAALADASLSTDHPYDERDAADLLLTKLERIQNQGYALMSEVTAAKLEKPALLSNAETLLGFEVLAEMPQSDELTAFRSDLKPWLAAHLERRAELAAAVKASDPKERHLRLEQTCETLQQIYNLTVVYAKHVKTTMPAPEGQSADPRVQELLQLVDDMEDRLDLYAGHVTASETRMHQESTTPPTELEKRFGFEVLAEMPMNDDLSTFRVSLNQLLGPYEKTVDALTEAIHHNHPDRFKLLGQAYTTLKLIHKTTSDFADPVEGDQESFGSNHGDPQMEKLLNIADEMHAELTSFWNDITANKDQMKTAGYMT